MIQQEMLQYQNLDIELNKIERELRKSTAFVNRSKIKAALKTSEEQLTRLEQRTLELRNQLVNANQALQKINAVIDEHAKELADIEDLDELNYMSKKLDEQMALLSATERDVKQIVRDAEEVDKSFENISKVQMPRLAAEYNRCNKEFEAATLEVKPRVMKLRQQQQEIKKAIDPALFEKYKRLSEQVIRVFVPLVDGNRCGGCQMEMPMEQVTTKIEKGYMTCEHCGRIIYKQ